MKISAKGRYGLRALVDIAAHSDDRCVTIKSIAERNGLPENYLEQLLPVLKSAGFVKSVRGAQGGYSLSRPACEISVGDVLRTLEGPMYPVDCIADDDDKTSCGGATCSNCVAKPVWETIYSCVNDAMDSISFEELVKSYITIQGGNK